jgi:hypothetical protein
VRRDAMRCDANPGSAKAGLGGDEGRRRVSVGRRGPACAVVAPRADGGARVRLRTSEHPRLPPPVLPRRIAHPELSDVPRCGRGARNDRTLSVADPSTTGVYLWMPISAGEASLGAQKVFATVHPLLGRDFEEVLRILWPTHLQRRARGSAHLWRRANRTSAPVRSNSAGHWRRRGV